MMFRLKPVIVLAAMLISKRAWSLRVSGGSDLENWTWPPLIVISLLVAAIVYSFGAAQVLQRSRNSGRHRRSLICFALGWISLVIALDSPLHEIGEQLFWVHMTQHEILMLISAPLLVLGQPLFYFLWALPSTWRECAANLGRSVVLKTVWKMISAPLSAWLLSAVTLWIWHAPWLFNRTLSSDWIHALQHTSFLVSGLLFWWPLASDRPSMGYGGALAYVFTTALHTSVLGALLTFAPRPCYSPYLITAPIWHLTALEDQQLGGLIMWIPAGTLLLVVFLFLLVKWMDESHAHLQYTRLADLRPFSDGGAR